MTISSLSHVGPSDSDPLTPGELDILLAIPRAAQSSPDSLLFRLPKGDHPSEGYVDLTCLQTCSLVSRLSASWRTRLSALLGYDVGPGTIVCIMARPYVHGIFHHLALWALGCTVQFMSRVFGDEMLKDQLEQSRCEVVIYCSSDKTWAKETREGLGIQTVELSESEYAHEIAQREVSSSDPAPEWPKPTRPSPAIIVQSSATTSVAKTMSFSLHFYTFGIPWSREQYLASKTTKSHKNPRTHPRLIYTAPFWGSYHRTLICNLVTATPISLVPCPDCMSLPAQELADWIEALDIGGLLSSAPKLRHMILQKEYTKLLQSMYSISMIGSVVDKELSDVMTQNQLSVTNDFGLTEVGRLLVASRPPYTHLRPCSDFPPPIALPLLHETAESEEHPQGGLAGREVELWYLVDSCPQLAHVAARGGVPLKLRPFPGPGPANGKLAICLEDVFSETYAPGAGKTGHGGEVAYMHLGRTDDYFRLADNYRVFSAAQFEIQARALIESELTGSLWQLDTLQLFGSRLPKTALVVQLYGVAKPDESTMESLHRAVQATNSRLGHEESACVDPSKRMLVVTCNRNQTNPPSEIADAAASSFAQLRLSYTHKHTLRRYQNVNVFEPWLKQLDWS